MKQVQNCNGCQVDICNFEKMRYCGPKRNLTEDKLHKPHEKITYTIFLEDLVVRITQMKLETFLLMLNESLMCGIL